MQNEKISKQQLSYLLIAYMQGSALLTTYVEVVIKKDSWLAVIAGYLVVAAYCFIYTSLVKRFPGMNLIEINNISYGKYLGALINLLYIFYFLMVLSFNIRFLGDLYTTFLMPETPLNFFLVVFPLVCAYAVWKGIEVLARISSPLVILTFLIILTTWLLLTPKMDFSNFLPLIEVPLIKLVQSVHITAAIPFGEIFIFLTFASSINDTKGISKNVQLALSLGFLSFFIILIRNIAVLGPTEAILTSPSIQASRLIEVGNVFNRMDILIGIIQTLMIFIKTSLLYYSVVNLLMYFLRMRTYKPLIIPIGAIGVILAATDWQSSVEAITAAINFAPIFITPFLFIFPLITIILVKIRRLSAQKGGERR